ncbi:LLM class F420-dependent oxidoreductase [soil metagenome]
MELALQTMTDYRTTLALARWAEDNGLAAMSVADHYLSGLDNTFALDQLTLLGAIAAATESIELSTLVSPVTFRHPAVMLKAAVTLDEISNGRFALGVGTGWMEEEHTAFGLDFPPLAERFERLSEALGYLRSAMKGNGEGYPGRYYRLAEGFVAQPKGDRVALIVGGSGPRRTPALAGTFADEFNASPSSEAYRARVEVAFQAASDAGRDPSSIRVSTAFPLVVAEDDAGVTERVRRVAEARGEDADTILARWTELGIPVGTVSQVVERLAEIESEGVTRVYFQVAFDSLEDIQRDVGLVQRHMASA